MAALLADPAFEAREEKRLILGVGASACQGGLRIERIEQRPHLVRVSPGGGEVQGGLHPIIIQAFACL